VDLVVRVLDVQVRIEGRKELCSFQMVEISADLRSDKNAPDFIDERLCRFSVKWKEAFSVSVNSALRAGIFKAFGSFDPMWFWEERGR
jgi:hypothetical protein